MFNHPSLSILLIVLYTFLLIALLHRITRGDRGYLSGKQVAVSFGVKILFGMLYGFLFMRLYHGDDTWQYHERSLPEYQKLLHHPWRFVEDTFLHTTGNMSFGAAYSASNSYWNDFEEVLFIRMLAIFDVLSFGNYYVNVVFFCFIAYIGNLLFFRLLVSRFPHASFPLRLAIFYYPMTLFWLSGIRKEGLLFFGMATALYYFNKLIVQNKQMLKNLLFFMSGILLLWLIRNLVMLCMAPALLAWYLHHRFRLPSLVAFTAVYALFVLLFFCSGYLPGFPDIAQKVTERQHSFLALEGNTRLPLDSLQGTAYSFMKVFPQALNHSFVRPYITECTSVLQLVSALDVLLFFGCAGIAFYFRKPDWNKLIRHPLILTCLFTAFAGYLIIGYTVPFPGAFVRYKSLFELLFISCFAVFIPTPSKEIKKTNIFITWAVKLI